MPDKMIDCDIIRIKINHKIVSLLFFNTKYTLFLEVQIYTRYMMHKCPTRMLARFHMNAVLIVITRSLQ